MRVFALPVLASMLACPATEFVQEVDGGNELPPDAGTPVEDAGTFGDAGNPTRDAGDAGTDGGTIDEQDAGSLCSGPGSLDVPFECEGDEDVCDPLDVTLLNATDVVATWSRVEGDEFVVEVRFRAMPFLSPSTQDLWIKLGNLTSGSGVQINFPESSVSGATQFAMVLYEHIPPVTFPPRFLRIEPYTAAQPLACTGFRLSRDEPLIELRVPREMLEDGELVYTVLSGRPNTGLGADRTWIESGEQLTASRGGRADVVGELVGYCELECPFE